MNRRRHMPPGRRRRRGPRRGGVDPMISKRTFIAYLILNMNAHAGVAGPALEGQGPVLLQEPAARVDFANATGARLECAASGSPPPAVKWLLADGSPAGAVPRLRLLAPNGSLVFPPFGAADFRPDVHRAVYRCQAANALGRVFSRDVRVRAVVMQQFRVEAVGAQVTRGNTAVLRCQVPAHVREFVTVTSWLQDRNFNIYPSSDGDGKLHMLPTGELLVRSVSPADGASRFQCRVTHRLSGETRASAVGAQLAVAEPRGATSPRFAQRLLSVEARRDELVVLPCVAHAHPPPEYRWELDGATLASDEQRYVASGLLVIPRARPGHSGRYACEASNAAGTARLEVNLLVSAPLSARVQPPILTAALGESATFTCSVAGHPVAQLAWLKDGQPVRAAVAAAGAGAGGGAPHTFALAAVTKDDQGMYQCVVKNEHDMAQGTAELRLGDTPPTLIYSFIRQTIQPGPSVSLKCVASGNPTPQIKWTLDGFKLPQSERFVIGQYVPTNGDVVSHVNITNVRVDDGGTYQCTAANRAGEIMHSADLNVYGSPRVRPMGDISAVAGETLYVTCPVAGYPIDIIEWFRVHDDGDRLLPYITRHFVHPNGTLMIEKVQSGEDDGVYRCIASNKQGDKSSEMAHVSVTVPPKITPFSFRSDLHLGERVGAQCVVSKGDPPLRVYWLKNGERLASSEADGLVLRNLDEFTTVLSINQLARHHGGNYTCVASNKAAKTAHSAVLSVNVPPVWRLEPRSTSARIGDRATLNCQADGFPPPVIVWKRATGQKIEPFRSLHGRKKEERPNDLDTHVLRSGTILLANGTLFIKNVSKEDEGRYICEASNGIGVGLSAVLYLTVHAPVYFKLRSKKQLVRRSTTATLHCEATGDLPITFEWRKEGTFLDLQGRISAKNVGGLESELRINEVSPEDGGTYTCFARNEYGHDHTDIQLVVQDAPEHPTNLHLVDANSRRITVAWTRAQDGNSPITRYIVRYHITQDPHSSIYELVVDGNMNSAVISPLRPAQNYTIHVLAENTLGPGLPSSDIIATTHEEAPSAPPQHVTVDAITATQLNLVWDPPPEDQWNGQLLGHYVGYRYIVDYEDIADHSRDSNGGTKSKQYNFTTVVFQGTGKEEAHLAGLRKYSIYGLVIQAFNSRGAGPLCDEVVGQTKEDVPEAPPRDVRCTALSSESLQVTWQPPPDTHVHGIIQGYRLLYEPMLLPAEDEIIESRTKTTAALSSVLHGLLKYTNYSLEMVAFTKIGDGKKSPKLFCRTKEDVPGPPSDIKTLLISSKTAVVSWLPPLNPNGVITKYNVYIRVVENGRQVDSRSVTHKSNTRLQYQHSGLKRHNRYEFWVTAFTSVGEGKSTSVASITPATKVSAGITSFGGTRVVSWKGDVRLECVGAGIPEPALQWKKNGDSKVTHGHRIEVASDGTLLISNVQRSDHGDYTCHVHNEHGSDRINYHLIVQVPPAPLVLLMTGSSQTTLQLEWRLSDTGGSMLRGIVIHYKHDHGEWEELTLDGTRKTHILAGLRCGTRYHVFVTAFNRVGTSEPSATLILRTRGGVPLLPQASSLLRINTTIVELDLEAWPDGGCPMLYFVVEYSQFAADGEEHWEMVGNNIRDIDIFPLVGLNPGQQYKLRVTAHNGAGSSVATFKFKTLSDQGAMGPSHVVTDNGKESTLTLNFIIVGSTASLSMLVCFLGVCFCMKKRSSPPARPPPEPEESPPPQESRKEMSHNEEYYATVRKIPPSPDTLECIPEYADDIRPYATFHVQGPPQSDSTKLQTFAYREREVSSRRSLRGDYRRTKRTRPAEEYDSFGSESDTEPGTSSRTESSNQLDYGRIPSELSRSYHNSAVRLPDIGLDTLYPGPEWCPPVEMSPRTHRRSFVRRSCHAHMLK